MTKTKMLLLSAVAVCVGTGAEAQSFPSQPIHIIVGVSPGGATDITVRLLAKQLTKQWNQPVIVESKQGAAGAIANEYVAKSKPDGYTLLGVSNDITALSASRSDLPYDLKRDFAPVSFVSTAPETLVIKNGMGLHSVKEFVDLAKSKPGGLSYGSPGVGSVTNLQTARFASMAGINIVHVPYKGASAASQAVAQGDVDMTFASYASMQGLAQSGKITLLALAADQRDAFLPSVPTIVESGGPAFVYLGWFGIFAPKGLPPGVLNAINAAIVTADKDEEMKQSLSKAGLEPTTASVEKFTAFVQSDLQQSIEMVKLAGVKPE